jgi:hypothetical protein
MTAMDKQPVEETKENRNQTFAQSALNEVYAKQPLDSNTSAPSVSKSEHIDGTAQSLFPKASSLLDEASQKEPVQSGQNRLMIAANEEAKPTPYSDYTTAGYKPVPYRLDPAEPRLVIPPKVQNAPSTNTIQ